MYLFIYSYFLVPSVHGRHLPIKESTKMWREAICLRKFPICSGTDFFTTTSLRKVQYSNQDKYDVILSYHMGDKAFANILIQHLVMLIPNIKVSVPVDNKSLRLHEIDQSKLIVPLLSQAYVTSSELMEEFHTALCRHRFAEEIVLFPIIVNELPPTPAYPQIVFSLFSLTDHVWSREFVGEPASLCLSAAAAVICNILVREPKVSTAFRTLFSMSELQDSTDKMSKFENPFNSLLPLHFYSKDINSHVWCLDECGNSPAHSLPSPKTASVVNAPTVDENAPVVNAPVVDENAPVVNAPVVDENAPVVDENAPVVNAPVVDENAPVVNAPVVDENAPVVNAPVVDENAPVVNAPVVDENAPVVNAPVVDAPVVDENAQVSDEKVMESEASIDNNSIEDSSATGMDKILINKKQESTHFVDKSTSKVYPPDEITGNIFNEIENDVTLTKKVEDPISYKETLPREHHTDGGNGSACVDERPLCEENKALKPEGVLTGSKNNKSTFCVCL